MRPSWAGFLRASISVAVLILLTAGSVLPAAGQSGDVVATVAGYRGPDRTARLEIGARQEGALMLYTSMPNEQYLYQITVEEGVRGRGYGRIMLQVLEALLTAEGAEILRLNVFHWNRTARALYDSAGYEVLSEGEASAGMCKRLSPGALENS